MGPVYFDNCFTALEDAVSSGAVTDSGYDVVLIDEGHDFDQRWLSLIARLFDNTTRSLLLMYDDDRVEELLPWNVDLNNK